MVLLRSFVVLLAMTVALIAAERPNVIIIFLDDSGYSDFHPFGNPSYPTPHVEQLAKDGMSFSQFYVPEAVCSASRAALMSGCYPGRTRVFGAHGPGGRGLSTKFATMAEVFKANQYATAHYGKWHIGDIPGQHPLDRGFDEHAGLMYSNDMWRYHPTNPQYWGRKPLQYWENGKVKINDLSKEDQKHLTRWSTEYAVDFIKRNKDKPFLLYLAHSMPHVPLFCSDSFRGKSGTGLYGDVIMELDWSVGEVLQAVKAIGQEESTIIVFSSDNGPWSQYGNHAGTTPFREHKATSFDGGTRSATIIKYPKELKGGSSFDKPLCTIDLLPTLAHLTGTSLPENEIDGKNVWPFITGSTETNPHAYYAFSTRGRLKSVLSTDGRWKLHLPHKYRTVLEYGKDGSPGKTGQGEIELSLFDLKEDPRETTNVFSAHPEIAERLQAYAKEHQARFYDRSAQKK